MSETYTIHQLSLVHFPPHYLPTSFHTSKPVGLKCPTFFQPFQLGGRVAWPNWLGRNGFPTSRVASDFSGSHERDHPTIAILQGILVGVGMGIGGATIQSPCNFSSTRWCSDVTLNPTFFFGGLAVVFWTTYQDVRERNEETERDKKIKQKACWIFHGSNGMVVEDLKGKNCNTQLL